MAVDSVKCAEGTKFKRRLQLLNLVHLEHKCYSNGPLASDPSAREKKEIRTVEKMGAK